MALLCAAACRSSEPTDAVRAWLVEWQQARTCLLPWPAPDGTTGAIIAELGWADPLQCHERLLPLMYPASERSGALGAHWDRALQKLQRVGRLLAAAPARRGPLLDDLDREVTWLARRTGMSDRLRFDAGPLLERLPAPQTLEIDGRPVSRSMFVGRRRFRGGLIAGRDDHEETSISFVVESPSEVRTWMYPRGSALAMPSGAWSVGSEVFPGRVEVVGALDHGTVRAAVLHDLEGARALAIATFDGTRWTSRFVSNARLDDSIQDVRTGAIDLLERGVGETFLRRVEVISGQVDSHRVRAPSALQYALCTDSGRTWYLTAGGLFRFDGGSGQHVPAGDDAHVALVDCQGNTALMLRSHPDTLERCQQDGCAKVLTTGRHHGVAALLADGGWIYAAALGDAVGVWREGASGPVFYRLTGGGSLATIAVMRGQPLLVLDVAGAYGFVPLP